MEDEKRALLVFPCPNCSEIASPAYTKRELETALEVGEVAYISHYVQPFVETKVITAGKNKPQKRPRQGPAFS